MKKSILFILFYFSVILLHSQTWQWVESNGNLGPDIGTAICIDGVGNCYAAGWVQNQARIFKYNSIGNLIWDVPAWIGSANAIVSDNNGYLYVAGDSSNLFRISKIDTAGNMIWKIAGSSGSYKGISLDNVGSIYVTGTNCFLAKYDTSGNQIWNQPVNATGTSIALDTFANPYLTGFFSGIAIFGTDTLTALGSQDIFITKYDSVGNCIWAKRAGGNFSGSYSNDCGYGIAVDQKGNAYITGSIVDSADFGSFFLIGVANDIFLGKYDSTGNIIWAKQATGMSDQEGRCITIDNQENILIAGSYVPNVNFDATVVTGWGNYDAFIAKYDSTGAFIAALKAGGTAWNELVHGICSDNLGNVFLTGGFNDATIFGSYVLFSNGLFDMFIGKIDLSVGIEEQPNDSFNTIVYPNPSLKHINIEFELKDQQNLIFEIRNILGQIVYTNSDQFLQGKQKVEVDISEFAKGLYFVQLQNNKQIINKKFIKQ